MVFKFAMNMARNFSDQISKKAVANKKKEEEWNLIKY